VLTVRIRRTKAAELESAADVVFGGTADADIAEASFGKLLAGDIASITILMRYIDSTDPFAPNIRARLLPRVKETDVPFETLQRRLNTHSALALIAIDRILGQEAFVYSRRETIGFTSPLFEFAIRSWSDLDSGEHDRAGFVVDVTERVAESIARLRSADGRCAQPEGIGPADAVDLSIGRKP
jgi:hypothetical protein